MSGLAITCVDRCVDDPPSGLAVAPLAVPLDPLVLPLCKAPYSLVKHKYLLLSGHGDAGDRSNGLLV